VSLDDEKVRQIIIMIEKWRHPVDKVAEYFNITKARIYQLLKEYRETGKYPTIKKRGRKPRKITKRLRQEIVSFKQNMNIGSVAIAKYIRIIRGIPIGNGIVHRILLEEHMTEKDPSKSISKKPWVRYEREHSLSAVHMDWHLSKYNGTWVCVVLDDASRMILASGEFEAATAENSIKLLEEAYQKYQHIAPIREVITDHGSQFYANKRDSDGNAAHSFEEFCKMRGIKHILARYNHPQSNGKVERWFQEYKRKRKDYETFEDFIRWYNEIRPHRSLDWDRLETPKRAFYRKAVDIICRNCIQMFTREEEKLCI
jgi:transposase